MEFKTLTYHSNPPRLVLLDQRKLPAVTEYKEYRTLEGICDAILDMVVRGAPAIGATAAYGMVIGAADILSRKQTLGVEELTAVKKKLDSVRPTAVNLMYGTKYVLDQYKEEGKNLDSPREIISFLEKAAQEVYDEDAASCLALSQYGADCIQDGYTILTHCNAGALATTEYGTALGVIKEAHNQGKKIHVYADETRPKLQGARLTAWELQNHGVPVTILPDSAAATLIRDGKIDMVITGADRIAANGDTANKIGTFMLSSICKIYQVPFYIAAPYSTIDLDTPDGKGIEIEMRDGEEMRKIGNVQTAPEDVDVYNPAFDVTPHENIKAIITDRGIIEPPYIKNILSPPKRK